MKRNILFLLCLFSFAYGRAQTLDRYVIASAGSVDKTSNISLEWTLGEPTASSAYSNNKMFTQGFNQPLLKVKYKTVIDKQLMTYKLTVAPNPVQSILNVYWWTDKEAFISLRLTDVHGKILSERSSPQKTGNMQFNMNNMASGMYFLQVRNSQGTLINTYQVVRM